MALDPNIALAFKPIQLNDPLETQARRQQMQANALAMRNAENQNALAQKAALDKQVMGKLYAESLDPNTGTVDYTKLANRAAQLGMGSEIPAIQTAGQEAKAKKESTTKDFFSNVSSAMDVARTRLEGVTTPEQFMQWHEQNHSDPTLKEYFDRIGVTPDQARAQIAAVANDPAAFADLLRKAQLGLVKAQEAVNNQATRDTQIEVQNMIGERMANRPVGRAAAPARAAGGAQPALGAPAAPAARSGKPGKAPPNPEMIAAAQDEKIGRMLGALAGADALIGATTTGVIGEVASRVGGTKAKDLSAKLETIKANLGFDELQKMRDASPTGGALGQVAVKELVALQSTVASLDQSQSPAELRKSIKKIEQHYNAWYNAVLKARQGGAAAAPAASGGVIRYDANGKRM